MLANSTLIPLNDGSPTHFSTRSTFTHVDLSLASPNLSLCTKWSVDRLLHGSDHFPIYINISKNSPHQRSNSITTRFNINKANWAKFQQHLSNTPINITSNNVNKVSAQILKTIRTAANLSIPLFSNHKRQKYTYWWSTELQYLRDTKQHSFKKFKNHPSTENLLTYKKANALFKFKCKIAKRDSFQRFSKQISPITPLSKIWSYVHKLYVTNTTNTIRFIEHNNTTTSDPTVIANMFANYWSDKSADKNFSSSFIQSKESVNIIPNYQLTPSSKIIEENITFLEVKSTLQSLKGKTPGFDKISYPILKQLPPNSLTYLNQLYNLIFNSGTIPHCWKISTIIPISKPSKDITSIEGYRPISLISCLSKLLEKIIAIRITWFLLKNRLLNIHQIAFKANKGTIDALSYIDHLTATALSHHNHISILSIDFEKAFDRVGVHTIISLILWNGN